jgi:hypothetical protein
MKVRMAIYNLKGKASIWWQYLKLAKGPKEKQLEWSNLKKYFKKNTFLKAIMKGRQKNFMNYDSDK